MTPKGEKEGPKTHQGTALLSKTERPPNPKMANAPNAKSSICQQLDTSKTEHVKCSEWKMLKL